MHAETKGVLPSGPVILLPPLSLRNYIKYFWYFSPVERSRPSAKFRIIPSGCPGIIFQHCNGHSAVTLIDGTKYPTAFLHGQDTKPCEHIDHSTSTIFSIRFNPTALKKLFGIDGNEVTDSIIPLDDVVQFPITDQLLNASDVDELIKIFSDLFITRMCRQRYNDMAIDEGTDLIIRNIHSINPLTLSKNYNISQRQFQRRFMQYVGVSPEKYIRIIKFQYAVNLMNYGRFNRMTDIAYELGYADQSHFNKDFKEFAGISPTEMLLKLFKPGISTSRIVQRRYQTTRLLYTF